MNDNSIIGDSFLNSKWFNPAYLFSKGYAFFHAIFAFLTSGNLKALVMTIVLFLALFFLTIICYCAVRLLEIRKKEHAHLQHEIDEYAHHQRELEKKKQEEGSGSKNERWNKTLTYLFSSSPGDWKLAVIEADSMLESLMGELGFKGETLGDKLKSATQENFQGLTSAWEVHTIRNRIAHEGLSFELPQREAKRVIALYEAIFRQYGFI